MANKYLSIVVAGRNDDYGVGFLPRMIKCMTHMREKLLRAGVDAEFIFVDWAYYPDRKLFSQMILDSMPWWDTLIAVHPAWQERIRKNPRLRFLEFFAKNVGIRRASGEFILSTNCDIFMSPQIIKLIASGSLKRDVLYRAVRMDLWLGIGVANIDDEILINPEAISVVNHVTPPLYTNASGDFQMMSREMWFKVRGFNEEMRTSKVHIDSSLCWCAWHKHHIPIVLAGCVYHLEHKGSLNSTGSKYGYRNRMAPFGPEWDWDRPYSNDDNWGLGNITAEPNAAINRVLMIDAPTEDR